MLACKNIDAEIRVRPIRKRTMLMNWDAIAAIAVLLAALGIIVSLAYLAGQVHGIAAFRHLH